AMAEDGNRVSSVRRGVVWAEHAAQQRLRSEHCEKCSGNKMALSLSCWAARPGPRAYADHRGEAGECADSLQLVLAAGDVAIEIVGENVIVPWIRRGYDAAVASVSE